MQQAESSRDTGSSDWLTDIFLSYLSGPLLKQRLAELRAKQNNEL